MPWPWCRCERYRDRPRSAWSFHSSPATFKNVVDRREPPSTFGVLSHWLVPVSVAASVVTQCRGPLPATSTRWSHQVDRHPGLGTVTGTVFVGCVPGKLHAPANLQPCSGRTTAFTERSVRGRAPGSSPRGSRRDCHDKAPRSVPVAWCQSRWRQKVLSGWNSICTPLSANRPRPFRSSARPNG